MIRGTGPLGWRKSKCSGTRQIRTANLSVHSRTRQHVGVSNIPRVLNGKPHPCFKNACLDPLTTHPEIKKKHLPIIFFSGMESKNNHFELCTKSNFLACKGPFIIINVLKFRFFIENVGGWVKGKYRKSKVSNFDFC